MNFLFILSLLIVGSINCFVSAGGMIKQSGSTECALQNVILDGLSFTTTGGNPFSPGTFEYVCSCNPNQQTTYITVFTPVSGVACSATFQQGSNPVQNVALNEAGNLDVYNSGPLTLGPGANQFSITCTYAAGSCTNSYDVVCTQTPPGQGGLVVGDPQFTGLRGQNYQVHGVSGEVYSIISDEHLQMNSKFVFLTEGDCPTIEGKTVKAGCWSHPGSYLGEIGIKTASGDKIKIVSGEASEGFAYVTLNGRQMEPDQIYELACPDGDDVGFVSFNNTHVVSVQAGNFYLEFENSDMFINQRVKVLDWASLESHGLLGQSWKTKTYNNPIKHIEGKVDDYVVGNKDLFGDNFRFNKFKTKQPASNNNEIRTIVKSKTKRRLEE